MNGHLNAFVPYRDRDLWHEDQLTRAAILIMRLVPPAHAVFMSVIGEDPAGLSEAQFDMQVAAVLREPAPLAKLVSVFLTPDEDEAPLDASKPGSVLDYPRAQRLDGVIRFEPDLVVVIESKIREGESDWQTRHVNLAGVEPRKTVKLNLQWQRSSRLGVICVAARTSTSLDVASSQTSWTSLKPTSRP